MAVARRHLAGLDDHVSVLRSSTAKIGTPTSAVMTPTGSSSGRTATRRDDIAEDEKAAAGEEDERQQGAVNRTGDGADGMRNDQSDEADDAARRHTGRGQERGTHVDHPHRARDVGAEMLGGLLAEREEIETSCIECEQAKGDDRVRGEDGERLPRGRAEPSEQPEEGVPRGRGVGEHHDAAHERDEERADDDPDSSSTRGSSRRPATRLNR